MVSVRVDGKWVSMKRADLREWLKTHKVTDADIAEWKKRPDGSGKG
jgi:hypothetical protein